MRSLALSTRLLAGLFVLAGGLITSVDTGEAGRQGRGQTPGPPPDGRGAAPGRDLPPRADVPAGTSSIIGTVIVSGSGAPARRARVTLSGEALRGGRSVTTDDQGRYAFAALPAGRFTLSASKIGHLTVSYGQRLPGSGRTGTPIQLEDGQRLNIRLQMPRGGVISGTLVDEQGEAVPGTQVRAFRYSMQGGARTLQPAGSDATDDRGIYRIYGLQNGDYVIGATPRSPGPATPVIDRFQEAVAALGSQPGAAGQRAAAALIDRISAVRGAAQESGQNQSGQDEPTSGYAPVYYPGTTTTSNATSVTLDVGEERLGVDFQLQLVPMARIEGVVIYPGGQEPGGLQIQLINVGNDVGGIGGSSTSVDRDGKFRFANVGPGQYSLIARTGGPGRGQIVFEMGAGNAPGPGGRGAAPGAGPLGRGGRGSTAPLFWATADLSIDGRDVSGVVLTLQPAFSMSGRLEFRGSLAPPADLTRMRVTLTPADMTSGGRQMAIAAVGRVDDSGNFTIDGVVPGRYRLMADGATGWSVGAAVLAGQDALDFPLDIRSSQNLTGAVVTFTDQSTLLSGAVTNAQGRPMSDYTLIIYPSDQRYWLPQSRRIRSVRPATDGTFSISGLPPGDYRLAPVLDPEPGSWFDATFLEQLDGASERFSLTEGEKKVQNVRVGS